MENLTKNQYSINMMCAAITAFSGGYMDAYTFIYRGHVFANAQTGNMMMLMWYAIVGELGMVLRYLFPILAFLTGIGLVNIVAHSEREFVQKYYREIMMGVESAMLMLVAFIPNSMDHLANAMVSFSCGLQVESIRRVGSNNIATTMCIGNLRNTMFYFTEYLFTKDKLNLKTAFMYFNINLAFVLGAGTEGFLDYICNFSQGLIIISSALIVLAIMIMIRARRKLEGASRQDEPEKINDEWVGD